VVTFRRVGAVLELGFLGPLEVRIDGGAPVAVGGARQKALLAVLALHPNEVVSADRLIDELWGDNAPATAAHTIQVFVSRLRGALASAAGRLTTKAPGYVLELGPEDLDVFRCERLYDRASTELAAGDARGAVELLREAELLWRGPPLADFTYEPFAQAAVARLEELRMTCREELIDAELAIGQHAAVVPRLEALVREQPFRERPRGQLMLALYRCGRQADALDAFQQARRMFLDELGLEPSPALRALEQAILHQDSSLDVRSAVPMTGTDRDKGATTPRLPLPWTLERTSRGAFVGREAELTRMLEWWASAGDEPRQPALIIGEPGIGKTRLASELARATHDHGALVLYGHCEENVTVPYQPFVEALRPCALALGRDGLEAELGPRALELARLWPELSSLAAPVHSDPEWAQAALFDATYALLEAAGRRRRVLLVLDDLQWAAGGTVLLMRHLIGLIRPSRCSIVGTYRDSNLEDRSPLGQMVASLRRAEGSMRLPLHGLDETAIASLVASSLSHTDEERDQSIARALHTQTSGNPFFVRELLADIEESGSWSAHAPSAEGHIDVPERVRAVIFERIARLSELARRSLNVAAVAGMTFPLPVVERVVGESDPVLDALDEATAAGLIADAGRGEYAFEHALVRQTLYAALVSARRIRFHRLIGEVLETLPQAPTMNDELAHHFAEAAADGQAPKAATYALAAGREAAARLGYEEAAAHYRRGLEALRSYGSPSDETRPELMLALADALWRTGEFDAAKRLCLEAAGLAGKADDAELLARAALGFAGPFLIELSEETARPAVELLSRALTELGPEETVLRASIMARLAASLAYGRQEARRPELAQDALEMVRRIGDSEGLALVLAMYHHVTLGPDSIDQSLAAALELARVASAIGDRQLELEARSWTLDHLVELGLADRARRELEAVRELAENLDDRFSKWLLTAVLGRDAQIKGHLDEFEALALQGFELGFESSNRSAAQIFGGQMVALRREQGRLAEVLEGAEALTAQYPAIAGWRCALAEMYAQLDREADARRELEVLASDAFASIPRDALWLSSLANLSEVVAFLDDADRAAELYEQLSPYATRNVVLFGVLCLGSISRHLGLLATVLSRYEQADRHFNDALEAHAKLESRLWTAHTQYNQASMLLRRDESGDRERALILLGEVLSSSQRHGFAAVEARARRSLGPVYQEKSAEITKNLSPT
jgi:DNA-binding SARP family transcriptional activator/tetratricopeptide (TPR) repeat protein